AGQAFPHPLLGHRFREPQRDQAPALSRGDAPCRPAEAGATEVPAAGDGDLGVARPGVAPGDSGGAGGLGQDAVAAGLELVRLAVAAAVAQELNERLQELALGLPVLRIREGVVRLTES